MLILNLNSLRYLLGDERVFMKQDQNPNWNDDIPKYWQDVLNNLQTTKDKNFKNF